MNIEYIGYVAAFLTTSSFLPQVVMTLRSGDTRSISLSMYALFVAGVALWLAYGLSIGAMPVIVANLLTLLLSSVILVLKLLHLRRDRMLRRSVSERGGA